MRQHYRLVFLLACTLLSGQTPHLPESSAVFGLLNDIYSASGERIYLTAGGDPLYFQGSLDTPSHNVYQLNFRVDEMDLTRSTFAPADLKLHLFCKPNITCVWRNTFEGPVESPGKMSRQEKFVALDLNTKTAEIANQVLQDLAKLQNMVTFVTTPAPVAELSLPKPEQAIQVNHYGQSSSNCSVVTEVFQSYYQHLPRFVFEPTSGPAGSCAYTRRDNGLRNAEIGTLIVTLYGNNGKPISSYKDLRANYRVIPVRGLGQIAEFIDTGDGGSFTLYRNDACVLSIQYIHWVLTNPDKDGITPLVNKLLGPYTPPKTVLAEPITPPAFNELRSKAQAGDAAAAYTLGRMCLSPSSGPPDYKGAAYWFTQASNRGMADASVDLSILCFSGLGLARDETKALDLLESTAKRGSLKAMTRLGELMIATNYGGVGSYYGEPWLRRAADGGNADALNDLGGLELTSVVGTPDAALRYFSQAAERGSCMGRFMREICIFVARTTGTFR